MSPVEQHHHKEFIDIAKFTGSVEKAIKTIEADVNSLFEQNRKKVEADDKRHTVLMNTINALDKKIYGMKIKFSLIGGTVVITGNILIKYIAAKFM